MNTLYQIKSKNDKILDLSKIGIVYNTDHSSAQSVAETLENILSAKGYTGIKMLAISGKNKNPDFPFLMLPWLLL